MPMLAKLAYAALLFLFLTSNAVVVAQSKFRVSGKVRQSTGEPLAGATIAERGTSSSALSKEDGTFTIDVANQNATLLISYVGYPSMEIKVNGQQRLDVTFKSAN